MERNRGFKIIAVIALVIGVIGLSIGFAAFSKTLNISSATVNTTARTNVFATAIHYDGMPIYLPPVNVTNINKGTQTTDTWSGISFTIDSNQNNASVTLFTRVLNDSTEYTGYLQSITSNNGVIECTPVGDTDSDLVAAACTKMNLQVSIAEADGSNSTSANITSTTPANKIVTAQDPATTITNVNYGTLQLRFSYSHDSTIPDGQFTVTIPAITFSYTSVPTGNTN